MGRLSPPEHGNKKWWFVLVAILVLLVVSAMGAVLISYYLAFWKGPAGLPDLSLVSYWVEKTLNS